MTNYTISNYRKGFEQDQVKIGIEAAKNWTWPYAYHLEGLLKAQSQPDFNPETTHFCFLDGRMVGYMFAVVTTSPADGAITANLDFPRLEPGHEQAADRLMDWAFDTLKKKGVSRVTGRVTTMCPRDIQLAQKFGFTIKDWGYKVYYSYEMSRGKVNWDPGSVDEIDPGKDLDACAKIAAKWYQRSPEWCRSLLDEWHQAGPITHLGVRQNGELAASCLVAPNDVRPSTAAIFYIHTPDENCLKPMLAAVVNKCADFGVDNVIADLIGAHRQFESVYQELGFHKVAEWARCDKELTC